jgi:trehalose 6-phosphate phosphatase
LTLTTPPRADLSAILPRVRGSGRLLLALDFDGTLAPIAETPEQAVIPRGTVEALRNLAGMEHVSVAILSGRSIADLKRRIDLDCIYVGNHGLEIEGGGLSFRHAAAGAMRGAVDAACWDLEAVLAGIRGTFVERKGFTAAVHYRQAPVDLEGWIETTVRLTMGPYRRWLDIRPARKAWEVRPRVDWDKGSALKLVLRHIGAVEPLLICAGDDAADEDMFAVSPDAISIHVGGRFPTAARYHLDEPAQLAELLGALAPAVRS